MKKVISLLLTITLLFSCGIIVTSAEDAPTDKLSPDLQSVIESSEPTDIIRLYIWLKGYEKTYHDMTIDEYNKYIDPLYEEVMPALFKDMSHFLAINTSLTEFNYIVVEVKVQDIEKLAAQDIVTKIDYAQHKYTPVECTIDEKVQELIDTSDPDELVHIQLWFSDHMLRKDDMPSWPDKDKATEEYSRYCNARDSYLAKIVLKDAEGVQFGFMGGGSFWIIKAKAKDIPGFAASGFVKEITYYDDSIIDSPLIEGNKIDARLAEKLDQLNNSFAYLRVYIELNIDIKTLKDMPSYPDIDTAENELLTYQWQTLKPQFDEAVKELKSIAHFPKQNGFEVYRNVCHDALIVKLKVQEIYEITNSNWVKSIKLYEPDDEWQTDHNRYDVSNTTTRYRERFLSQYDTTDCGLYQELFHHEYTSDDKSYGTDWALVKASNACIVCDVCYWGVVGGRLLYAGGYKQQPFTFDVGLYDAEQDRFFDVTEIDFDDYTGLYEVWQQLDLGFCTSKRFLGDADGDQIVTILDATKIQRGIAGLESRNNIVATGADVDGDGEMTVMDATRIQRYKADLCELDGTIKAT